MGPEITSQGRQNVHEYMMDLTEPYSKSIKSSSSVVLSSYKNILIQVITIFSSAWIIY